MDLTLRLFPRAPPGLAHSDENSRAVLQSISRGCRPEPRSATWARRRDCDGRGIDGRRAAMSGFVRGAIRWQHQGIEN